MKNGNDNNQRWLSFDRDSQSADTPSPSIAAIIMKLTPALEGHGNRDEVGMFGDGVYDAVAEGELPFPQKSSQCTVQP